MALRTPLVLVTGQIQQLQAADSIAVGSVSGGVQVALTNNEAGSIVIGTPVYINAANGVLKAKADASPAKDLFGLVADVTVGAGASATVQVDGVLSATTGQWDAVFGTTGGLTFGQRYYLSAATAGLGTATPPSTVGQYVQQIGIALSTTKLKIDIQANILL